VGRSRADLAVSSLERAWNDSVGSMGILHPSQNLGKNVAAKGKSLLLPAETLFHSRFRDTSHFLLISRGYVSFCISVTDGTRLAAVYRSPGDRADF
jgi:hypothetical protein